MKKTFSAADRAGILTFINENIEKHKLKASEKNRASLMAEETLLLMLDHTEDEEFTVNISYLSGTLRIKMQAKGKPFDLYSGSTDPMQTALMQSFAQDIRLKHQKQYNVVTITAYKSRYLLLIRMGTAAVLGIVLSLMMKAAFPPNVCASIAKGIMTPGKDMFMNCLNMLIPPLVFF